MFTHACAEALTFLKKCYFGNFVLLKLFWPCKNQEHLLGLHGMFLHARAKTITFIENEYFGNFVLSTPYRAMYNTFKGLTVCFTLPT
jgi:hypothetical protein